MPTRNRAVSLSHSLKSIQRQTYARLDILISDNASEDGTEALCRSAAAADPRIRYVRHPTNLGLHGNHNFCLDEARGEYLCVFHDHDRHRDGIVSEYVAFLDDHPRVGVVCSDWELIDDDDKTIGIRDHGVSAVTSGLDYISQTIRTGRSSIGIPGAMIRTSALRGARFDPSAPIGFGDFPVWFRMAENADVGHINRRLWSWRQNRESHSARTIESIAGEYQRNLEQFCQEHLVRWPDHVALVAAWRQDIRRYLFWALAYEIALHFRTTAPRDSTASRSLFEIMDYRLTPPQFSHAMTQMESYCDTSFQSTALAAIRMLIRARCTWPLAWAMRHQRVLRNLLKLN